MRLKDKVAIVTGAASGIGKAIAERFAREGALIIIADQERQRDPDCRRRDQGLGRSGRGVRVDVTDREQIQAFIGKVVEAHRRIDILVNNAGITRYRPS